MGKRWQASSKGCYSAWRHGESLELNPAGEILASRGLVLKVPHCRVQKEGKFCIRSHQSVVESC